MSSFESSSQKPMTGSPEDASSEVILNELRRAGVEVEETNKDTFPLQISTQGFDGLSDRGRAYFDGLVATTRRFWSGLIIKDHFDLDEDGRTAFERNMLQRFPGYKDFENRSKLRTNVHTELCGLFRGLVRELDASDIHSTESEKVREMYASLFPIEDVGRNDKKASEAWARAKDKFPSFPALYDARSGDISYRSYYLRLKPEQRYLIIDTLDKAAHDFLELVTRTREDELAEKINT